MVKDSFERNGVTYIRLDMRCPNHEASFRADKGHQYWQHKNCGGDIYLGDNATLLCYRDNYSFPLKFAKFECPICTRTAEGFIISNSDKSNTVSDLFSCLNMEHISFDFIRNFIQASIAHREEYPSWFESM